jgi:hypothetical protein
MHRIDDAIVQGGKLVLSNLPFAEGQHVRVVVAEVDAPPAKKLTIQEVRRLLKGSVIRFDDPCEPIIPLDDWDILK